MRCLSFFMIIWLFLCSASAPVFSETISIWRFGIFDGSSSELISADSLPRTVNVRVDSNGVGSGFPDQHSPPDDDFNPDNSNIINISFFAEPGNYTLRIGQMFTHQPETVTVSLDGSSIGTFTTVTRNNTHELKINITRSGSHTITFEEFYGNNGYAFDAVELVMDIAELTAMPNSIYLLAPGDIGTFSLYGGIGDYRVTTNNNWIAEVDLSNNDRTVYVKAVGPGQTKITVEDQASNYVEIIVSVDNNDNKNPTYDLANNVMTIPSLEINGSLSRSSYTIKGSLHSHSQLALLLALIEESSPENLENLYFIMISTAIQN